MQKYVYKISIQNQYTKSAYIVYKIVTKNQKYVQNGYKISIQNRYTFCTYKTVPFYTYFGYMRRILYPFCKQCNAILYIQIA